MKTLIINLVAFGVLVILGCDDNKGIYVVNGTGVVASNLSRVDVSATYDYGCEDGVVDAFLFSGQNAVYQTRVSNARTFQVQYSPGNYELEVYNGGRTCFGEQVITMTAGQAIGVALTIRSVNMNNNYNNWNFDSYWNYASYLYKTELPINMVQSYVYFKADQTAFEFDVVAKNGSNILLYAPSKNGKWLGQVEGNKLSINQQTYPSMSYMVSMNSSFETTDGVCTNAASLVSELTDYLKYNDFPAQAEQDLASHLKLYTLDAAAYCYYIQNESYINGSVTFDLKPTPQEQKRVWFMIVAHNDVALNKKQQPHKQQKRALASAPQLKLYEWGIGFKGGHASRQPSSVKKEPIKKLTKPYFEKVPPYRL